MGAPILPTAHFPSSIFRKQLPPLPTLLKIPMQGSVFTPAKLSHPQFSIQA